MLSVLILKAPITPAADDNFFLFSFYLFIYFFFFFQRKQVLKFHVKCLHMKCRDLFSLKKKNKTKKQLECRQLQILLGR